MTEYPLLSTIDSPDGIKQLNPRALHRLSEEISQFMQEIIKEVGGHYSSPLGVVDLTIALHCIYNSPLDCRGVFLTVFVELEILLGFGKKGGC